MHTDALPTRSFDVAVIGAGPAGANAALTAARGGASVVLVERATLPRYKTCGGGVVQRALRFLPRDLELPLERECTRVEMRFATGSRSFAVEREHAILAMAMRAPFDHALVNAAVAAGASLLSPCELAAIDAQSDMVELATSTGRLRARFVIGADGAVGATARLAGWTERVHTIPALEAEVVIDEPSFARLSRAAHFDLGTPAGGYGWIFPKLAHLSAGVLTMQRGSFDLRGALMRYLAGAGALAIESIERHGHVIPIAPRQGGLARGRVLLAGDAAGLADPLTGEGISYALESGAIAARALLDGDFEPNRVRALHRDELRATILAELRVARWLAHLLYRRPTLAAMLFERSGQALCEALTDVVIGRKSYRELALNPLNYVKLLATRERA
jgi:geranylgeranyl reductase family protein